MSIQNDISDDREHVSLDRIEVQMSQLSDPRP
jgi:hypothetical protein